MASVMARSARVISHRDAEAQRCGVRVVSRRDAEAQRCGVRVVSRRGAEVGTRMIRQL
mgnify:CR=1 FL=1